MLRFCLGAAFGDELGERDGFLWGKAGGLAQAAEQAYAASSNSPSTVVRPVQRSRMERTPHGPGGRVWPVLDFSVVQAKPPGNGSGFTFRMPTGPAGTACRVESVVE